MAQPEVSQTQLYEWLTGDDDSRMCDDIPDDACQEQPHNFFLHLYSTNVRGSPHQKCLKETEEPVSYEEKVEGETEDA